jgi:membrane-associated protease RseP (regulator of RpoE activity)
MKISWAIAVGVAMASAAGASAQTQTQAAPAFSQTTVRVQVVANLVEMPGYVNGSQQLMVVLDTGASLNVISPEIATQLGLKAASDAKAAGLGKGEDETLHIIDGVTLAWGYNKQLSLANQKIATLPLSYIGAETGHPLDGIFGSSLFEHYQVRVNYELGEVAFAQSRPSAQEGAAIPIAIYGDVPFVNATIDTASGQKVQALFMVDSGTTGPLILSRKFLAAHPAITERHPFVDVPDVSAVGGAIGLQMTRLSGLDLGPFHLDGPIAAVPQESLGVLSNDSVAGIIGAGILSRFLVDWDYANKTMGLTPNVSFATPFETDASGLRLSANGPQDSSVGVRAVQPASPAAEAGLQPGDIIEKVNGKPAPALWKLAIMLAQPDSTIELSVLRDGRRMKVKVHLRRLI